MYDVVIELQTIATGDDSEEGAWSISSDHGLAYNRWKDGAADSRDKYNGCEDPRAAVFRDNLDRVRRADAVFAYVARKEAYGTVIELGVAIALCKPIFIGYPHNANWRRDLWFAEQAALGCSADRVGSVGKVWATFCKIIGISVKSTN